MNRMVPLAAISFVLLSAAPLAAAELPSFEASGFPISPVQVSVLGTANVQEAPPVAAYGDAPASAHQIAVLTPRAARIDEASLTRAAATRR
jgi:hypothetical protein